MGKTNIARNSITFGATTLCSRILGMVRDVVVASSFGTSAAADAFYVAFRFANLFRAFFAEGAFSQAFVPNLARVIAKDPQHERLFIGNMLVLLGGSLLLLLGVLELGSNQLAQWYALGYRDKPEHLALVNILLQITMPYALLISVAALFTSVLQSHNRFFISGFSPVVLNLCLIGAALYAGSLFAVPIAALGWATLVAGTIQMLMPLAQMAWIRKLPVLTLRCWHPTVKRSLVMFGPVVLSASVTQIAMLIDTILATYLPTGSVTWLYIANRLINFPLGIFGISIAIVVMPILSRAAASNDPQQGKKIFAWAVHCIFLIAIPATCALLIVAEPIVMTLFQYGAFLPSDARNASDAVRMYAIGLTGMMLIKVLISRFLAAGDAKTPLRIALVATSCGVLMSLILMQFIAHRGIALSTGVVSLLNASALYVLAYKRGYVIGLHGCGTPALRIGVATLVLAGVCLLIFGESSAWENYSLGQRIVQLSLAVGLAASSYLACLYALGLRLSQLRSP